MPAPAEEQMEDGEGFKGKGKMKGKGKGKGKMIKGKGKGKGFKGGGGGGQMMVQERVVYQRQSRNAGQHTIEMYYPQFYFSQMAMEEFDARPDRYGPSVIGKYTKGIGQIEGRFPTDDEDPISFAMTVVHRLLERMELRGFNQTGQYQPDGVALNVYNAVGRLDIGTESITDRSKSMKSFVMDIFERYGNGESNIEGVDQYNACYGGQACGLCTLSWVESDRWDGRYGIAVATDISEAHPAFMAFAGAATTACLFFPDAPLPHHSQRASCILHRFDFFKPVGWHDMAPITDGKYSVECYLDALDACYKNLRKKLNGRDVLAITDYNVFHTGGGYHIVRKAFERLVRNELPDSKGAERDALVETKLHPSVSLLKVIGPCHTVSSFLNTASIIMNTMEKGLGKVICVFTYGSGCASSMYQMRIDDVPFFDPIEIWKLKFYRFALKCDPQECIIHNFYVETWMKFDYRPIGRKMFKIPISKYQDDVYYLMEIDAFGRRFYHRGGLKTGPMDKKLSLPVDYEEDRGFRPKYGPVPEAPEERQKSQEEVWRDIEYEMTYDHEAEEGNFEEVGEFADRYNSEQKVTIIRPYPERKRHGTTIEPDGLEHSYQIVGTWSRRQPEEMMRNHDGSWLFAIVLSENRWEEFYLIQDWDPRKRIYPFQERSFKGVPTVGPHDGGHSKLWFLDCRDRMDVPEEQVGMPGDKYLVTFRWNKLKELTWDKLEGETGEAVPGQYFASGSWADWDYVELAADESKPGWFHTEVQMTSLGIEFKVVRNEDPTQSIYPLVLGPGDLPITQHTPVQGPDTLGGARWKVEDSNLGSVYRVSFYRDPDDCEPTAMKVMWDKIGEKPLVEPEPNYYIIAAFNGWGARGMTKMARVGQTNAWTGEVPIELIASDPSFPEQKRPMMPFKMIMHKMQDRVIHPDKEDCTQLMRFTTVMDDESSGKFYWLIGKAPSDKAKNGDTFIVRLELQEDGNFKVSWSKKMI